MNIATWKCLGVSATTSRFVQNGSTQALNVFTALPAEPIPRVTAVFRAQWQPDSERSSLTVPQSLAFPAASHRPSAQHPGFLFPHRLLSRIRSAISAPARSLRKNPANPSFITKSQTKHLSPIRSPVTGRKIELARVCRRPLKGKNTSTWPIINRESRSGPRLRKIRPIGRPHAANLQRLQRKSSCSHILTQKQSKMYMRGQKMAVLRQPPHQALPLPRLLNKSSLRNLA
jgi:hypothetical protein